GREAGADLLRAAQLGVLALDGVQRAPEVVPRFVEPASPAIEQTEIVERLRLVRRPRREGAADLERAAEVLLRPGQVPALHGHGADVVEVHADVEGARRLPGPHLRGAAEVVLRLGEVAPAAVYVTEAAQVAGVGRASRSQLLLDLQGTPRILLGH